MNADKIEEVELARTLLAQGHIETAQKVLLKICQEQPEFPQAFRALAQVLERRGDDKRARVLAEYAQELDGHKTAEIAAGSDDDLLSDAETSETRMKAVIAAPAVVAETKAAAPAPVASAERLVAPPSLVTAQEALTLPSPMQMPAATPTPQAPSPVLSSGQMPRARRRGLAVLLVVVGIAVVAAAVAGYTLQGRGRPARPSAREELDRALASGSLEGLMRARDLARIALEGGPADADALVRLGLVNALLAADYAMDAIKEADEALARADAVPLGSAERSALAATARALLALSTGNRAQAKLQADSALATDLADPPAFALLASARVRALAGDADGAAKDLDRAVGIGPDLLPIVVDWAAARIEDGDPVVARRSLLAMLGKSPDNSRAQLVLAHAERALGETTWTKRLETACSGDSKISRAIRADCATQAALQARLDGDRLGAIRKAKAIAQTTDNPTLLAQLSALLALLGEVDVADELFQKAGKGADAAMPALRWASLAIRLGRGEAVEPSPLLEHPAGPEPDLIAARAAFALSGREGLAAALKAVPPGILDIDWDIRAFAVLAHESAAAKPELLALEKKGDKGNPVASYVLGVFAFQDKDFKLAARRFERSLSLHGDGCRAATSYLEAFSHLGRGAVLNKAALRAVRARNAKCPVPET